MPEQIKLDFPSHHPAYYRFIHDDEGRLYVQNYEKTEKFNTYYHDVFDQDGRYKGLVSPGGNGTEALCGLEFRMPGGLGKQLDF